MTVCIAARNEKDSLIAFATDRMVTSTFPPIEFEHKMPKMTEISDYCVALSAGDATKGKEIFDAVKQNIKDTGHRIAYIAEQVKETYQIKRLQLLENLHLRARGINHAIFIKDGAKLLPQNIYNQIDYAFATFMFSLEILIAGVEDSGPSIHAIRNPGLVDCYNSIGFHAIGSGSMHALASLIETYDPKVDATETLYSVFRAKKIAEVAPGVGVETDLGIIIKGEKIKYYGENAELFREFNSIYEKEKKSRKELIKQPKVAILNNGGEGNPAKTEQGES